MGASAFIWRRYLYHGILLLLLLLATGLRFASLDAQSFWNDEGNTARLVERVIPLIIEGAAGDVHPPGYYLLLHMWRALVGETEFALRSFSAFSGVLTVALTASISRTFLPRMHKTFPLTMLPSVLFITINPLSIYYSQEARMYAQLELAVTGLLWAAISFYKEMVNPVRENKLYANFILIAALSAAVAFGLYTHYAFVFALASLSCAYGLYWLLHERGNWRMLVQWVIALMIGGLLFLPWVPVALGASGWRPPDLGAPDALTTMARTLVVGITLPVPEANYAVCALIILGILISMSVPHAPFAAWAASAMAFLPMGFIAISGIYRPAYLKFMVISVSPLAVSLSALHASRLYRRSHPVLKVILPLGLLLMYTPVQVKALQHLYRNPAFARDDYRSVVRFLEEDALPGDAVVLNAPNQWEVYTYYDKGILPVYTAPYQATRDEMNAWVEKILTHHTKLYVLYWGETEADPERLMESALARQAFKAKEKWISSIRLAWYGTVTGSMKDAEVDEVALDQNIQLKGYRMQEGPLFPGEILPLTLVWSVEETPSQRYKVFVHLVNQEGNLKAQTDAEPGGGLYLTDSWRAGLAINDNYGVLLPFDVQPGVYDVLVGMYDFSGRRLPVTQNNQWLGDSYHLDKVIVQERQ